MPKLLTPVPLSGTGDRTFVLVHLEPLCNRSFNTAQYKNIFSYNAEQCDGLNGSSDSNRGPSTEDAGQIALKQVLSPISITTLIFCTLSFVNEADKS